MGYGSYTMPTKDFEGRERVFELVDTVPRDYVVWNIGEHMGTDRLIPFTQVKKGTCDIVLETLKAVKLEAEDVLFLRHLASKGISNLAKARARVKRLESKKLKHDPDWAALAEAKEAVRVYSMIQK